MKLSFYGLTPLSSVYGLRSHVRSHVKPAKTCRILISNVPCTMSHSNKYKRVHCALARLMLPSHIEFLFPSLRFFIISSACWFMPTCYGVLDLLHMSLFILLILIHTSNSSNIVHTPVTARASTPLPGHLSDESTRKAPPGSPRLVREACQWKALSL